MISFNNLGNLGRLANQMFQYASLKGIARNRGYEFSIPPKTVFGTRDPMVNKDVMNIYNVFKLDTKNKVGLIPNKILSERMHTFDDELFLNCPDNIDLFGYYQTPKYFEHIENCLDELNDIIKQKKPRYFFIANSFNTVSYGHFLNYKSFNDE